MSKGEFTNHVSEHLFLSGQKQGILTKSKYYSAIGSIADAALSRMLRDIIALPDIPEIESHRLSELCRILNSMEGLFSEDPDQVSSTLLNLFVDFRPINLAAFIRCCLCTKLAQVFISVRAPGLFYPLSSEALELNFGDKFYRKLRWQIFPTCLNKGLSSTSKSMNW